ncbi:MAG: PIN domain-containing protein, partial [Alphaproteobacteria bacterium]|nr:PIN domain-containing protein [Alphaproteobacteria bacterium]
LQLERWLQETLATLDERVLPVDAAIAHRWGQLQARLGRKDFDVGIAATALEHKLRVVTGNVRHFETTGAVVINPFGAA